MTVGALMAAEPLAPLPAVPFPAVIEDERTVSAQALVAWHGNSYSVPPGHGGQRVTVRHQLGSPVTGVVTTAGTVLARHRREPDHAGAVVRDEGHVTALEKKVLAARGEAGRPCRRKERRPPSAEAAAEAAAIRGQAGPGGAGHRLRRVGGGGQAAAPGRPGLTAPRRHHPHLRNAGHDQRGIHHVDCHSRRRAGRARGRRLGQEPEVSVPVSVIGDTAELMTLAAELIDASRDGVIRARTGALLEGKGAEPRPAADWMITSIRSLAREAEAVLACEGIACDRGLARYWRLPRARR